MAKGDDSTTTTTTSDLPEYIKPYVDRFLPRAETASTLPYQQYGGQRLAQFSPDTQAAFTQMRNTAGQAPTGITNAMQTAQGVSGFQPGQISTQDFTQANIQGYMNPYIQNVLDVQKQRAQQSYQEQQAGRDASAIQAGAFGGNRRFVQDSLAQRDLNQQMQGIEAEGLQRGFDTASGLFTSDQARNLQAQMANEESRRMGAGLSLDAAKTGADLQKMYQQYGFSGAEALSGIGAKEQQREQAGLDLAYQDFQRQRDYPYEQLSKYSSLLYGQPIQPTTTQTTTQPAPDFLSQLIGAVTAGAGFFL
jgi:hypothetical protein